MYYNPNKHHRRSIRLPGYDYAQPGAYFVTINTYRRELLFGDVVNGEMQLNVYGRVAATFWERIPHHFPHVRLDGWVVMPDHIHGIIVIVECEAAPDIGSEARLLTFPASLGRQDSVGAASPGRNVPSGPASGSLGAIVGNYKSITTRRVNKIRHTPGVSIWQRNYYEHIIRNESELHRIRAYIAGNPAKWVKGRYYHQ